MDCIESFCFTEMRSIANYLIFCICYMIHVLRERDKSKGPPASKPQAKPTVKKSDDIDFGDDDGILDGLGFDDTPRGKEIKMCSVV